jgi:hypothetical protein
MARGAALGLDGRMLVNERSQGVDVTLGADRILGRTNVEQFWLEGAMRVVAVRALY